MSLLDFAAFDRTPLVREPFDHLVVEGAVAPDALPAVLDAFPPIRHAGLVPPAQAHPGPALDALLVEIHAPAFTAAVSAKFGLPLGPATLMTLLRGRCSARDGRIHTDSVTKQVTGLLYLNRAWDAPGGRLRLLRGPDDIEDAAAEIAPSAGTLVLFRRSDRSFHGHKPFVGDRRYIMLNWMTAPRLARREMLRHALSARIKQLGDWLGGRGAPAHA